MHMGVRVICLGAINLDLSYQIARKDFRYFQEVWPDLKWGGEVAVTGAAELRLQELLARHARLSGRFGGGQAANTAYSLGRLGLDPALVGRVGADADGDFLREELSQAGVQVDYLVRQGKSGRAYILTDPGDLEQERTILVAPNTNDDLAPGDIPWEALATARFLHFTSFVGDKPLEVQGEIGGRLPDDGPGLSLDPGELYARRGREVLAPLLSRVETLLATETEWGLLGGEISCHPAWAPPVVVIKRGARGARLLTPLRYLDFPVELGGGPVDTLGAGDVFAAGYLAGRLNGFHLNACVRLGNRAAAFSIQGAGRTNYPDKEFLQRQLADLRR
jgi:sugar/nucleoside kinase (ribokinase family)